MLFNKKHKDEKEKFLLKEREAHHQDLLKMAKNHNAVEKVAPKSFVSLQNINKIYPNHVQAVYDFNLDIERNEFIVFVGPSGCGKSTTLRMIAGLEDITYGDLFIDGVYANDLPPKDRNIGMVFQNYALYPHMTVYENIAFALIVKHVDKKEIDERVQKAADILQLKEYLDRKPSELSGGQCQRVALGRAIVASSDLFLMDEPLSNLDAKLRVTMRSEIINLHKTMNKTTIYVTHDQTEAMTMADRIVVMKDGRVQQIGTPEEVFNTPANIFVASFIGSPSMNLITAKTNNNDILFDNGLSIKMSNEFNQNLNSFYLHEIENTKEALLSWKDILLNRFKESKKYKNMVINNRIRVDYLKDLFKKLDKNVCLKISIDHEQLLSKLISFEHSKDIIEELDSFLKNYLFALEEDTNPEIISLKKIIIELEKVSKNDEKNIIVGIRPEHFISAYDGEEEVISSSVKLAELLGIDYLIHLDVFNNDIIAKISADHRIMNNSEIKLKFNKSKIHFFDPITNKRISAQ